MANKEGSHEVAVLNEDRVAFLEKQLALARAGEAASQFALIELQHRDFQQQERSDQLEKTSSRVNLALQALHSKLEVLQHASPSDEECGHSHSDNVAVASLQLQSYELRLGLQQSQLDSLRASRDSLLAMRQPGGDAAGGDGVPVEMQLQSLLQYTQDLEKLLDACVPGSGALDSRRASKDVPEKHRPEGRQIDFMYDSCPAGVQLKPRLSKGRVDRHAAMGSISNASTSVGGSSVGYPEDVSPGDFLLRQWPSGIAELQPSPKDKSANRIKKVEQRVRFRPMLRMHRDRSGSPDGSSKRPIARRSSSKECGGRSSSKERASRSSSKEHTRREHEKRDSTGSIGSWSLSDFTDWYA